MRLYLEDFEELIYESDKKTHHIDVAGTTEFKVDFNFKNVNVSYKEIILENFKIGYGSGFFKEKTTIFFDSEEETVEMHFMIKGNSTTFLDNAADNFFMTPSTHNIYYGNNFRGKLEWDSKEMFFFEINISPSFFDKYLPNSGQFDDFKTLVQSKKTGTMSAHDHPITSEMYTIINSIINCSLTNELRKLFLEAKILELLLLQLSQMQQCEHCFENLDTSKKTIDKMYLARDIIVRKLNNPISLSELSREINTNECTLKKEFKNIFGTTVFGYIRDIKMDKAKNILLNQNISINEVSDIIGYKNPQHFSTAFKRKFGISPRKLRS